MEKNNKLHSSWRGVASAKNSEHMSAPPHTANMADCQYTPSRRTIISKHLLSPDDTRCIDPGQCDCLSVGRIRQESQRFRTRDIMMRNWVIRLCGLLSQVWATTSTCRQDLELTKPFMASHSVLRTCILPFGILSALQASIAGTLHTQTCLV